MPRARRTNFEKPPMRMTEGRRICRATPKSRPSRSTIPLALEAGEKIVTLRSMRNDPLGRLHWHRQIDEAQYHGGRAFQDDWEKAERGPQAVDPTREYVDGGRAREPITERQRRAVLRLNRIERELGADGSALVHEVLVLGLDHGADRPAARPARSALDGLFRAPFSGNASIGWR